MEEIGKSFKENNLETYKYTESSIKNRQYLTEEEKSRLQQFRKAIKWLKIALAQMNPSTAWKVQAQFSLWIMPLQC